jgi:hypothetical protein
MKQFVRAASLGIVGMLAACGSAPPLPTQSLPAPQDVPAATATAALPEDDAPLPPALTRVKIRWVPTQHMLADPLTKVMDSGALKSYMKGQQEYALVQDAEESAHEQHKADLRRGQRQRRKEKLRANTEASS